MTAINPWAIQANSHPASTVRQAQQGQMGSPVGSFAGGVQPTTGGGGHGVCGATDLAVTQNGTPNMSVNVAQGLAAIRGTESQHQGVYGPCYNDGTVNLAISAADPTNARKDLICARIRDAQYSGANNDFALVVVTGTPAGSPADPAVPANTVVLARVLVAAAAATIVNANITDLRPRASALGGTIMCTSATRPTGAALYQGLDIYETDTKNELVYDGANWSAPKNRSLGELGRTQISTNKLIANSAAEFDPSFSAAVTVLANRKIEITLSGRGIQSSVANDVIDIYIKEDGTEIARTTAQLVQANGTEPLALMVPRSPSAGAHTYAVFITRNAGTGTGGFIASATDPTTLLVKDIGGT